MSDKVANADADPESSRRRQEGHPSRPHRPGLRADAQEHVPHIGSQKHPPHEAGHSSGPVSGSLQPHGLVQRSCHKAGVERGGERERMDFIVILMLILPLIGYMN